MSKSNRNNYLLIAVFVVWQVVVYALSVAGIFGAIYEWLGIPWNATGFTNLLGTIVGLALLELPLLVTAGLIVWMRRRRRHEKATV